MKWQIFYRLTEILSFYAFLRPDLRQRVSKIPQTWLKTTAMANIYTPSRQNYRHQAFQTEQVKFWHLLSCIPCQYRVDFLRADSSGFLMTDSQIIQIYEIYQRSGLPQIYFEINNETLTKKNFSKRVQNISDVDRFLYLPAW